MNETETDLFMRERERQQDRHHFCKLVFKRSSLPPQLKILSVQLFQCHVSFAAPLRWRKKKTFGGECFEGSDLGCINETFLRIYRIVHDLTRSVGSCTPKYRFRPLFVTTKPMKSNVLGEARNWLHTCIEIPTSIFAAVRRASKPRNGLLCSFFGPKLIVQRTKDS